MGRVRNKMIKRASRQLIERYYSRLTFDFDTNKRITEEVAEVPSKRVRNKLAGFVTHLMKRIQRGPVRGISLKLQEAERERRMDFIPERSALDVDTVEIDRDTNDLLHSLNITNIGAQIGSGAAPRRNARGNRPHKKMGEKKTAAPAATATASE